MPQQQTIQSCSSTHTGEGEDSDSNRCIVINRNKFVEDSGIVSRPTKLPAYIYEHRYDLMANYGNWCDHLEEYKDTDGNWILISSPLKPLNHTEVPEGWHLMDNLYTDKACYGCTICKVVAPRQKVHTH